MHALVLVAAVCLLSLLPLRVHAADEPDEQMPGAIVVIKPAPLFKFVSRPPSGASFALPEASNDPTVEGATLDVADTGGAMADSYALPPGGWKGLGNPAGTKGYKYKGAGSPTDPCRVVLVKGAVVKAVCKGAGVTLAPPFTGDVAIVLTVGTDSKRYCARFGGEEVKNDATLLKRKSAPAGPCPGSPSTTTTIETGTTSTTTTIATVAFRMSDLDLRDPHAFVDFLGCRDVTDTALAGFAVNGELQTSIQTDGDMDSFLDLSLLSVFAPLDQSVPASGTFEFVQGECTAPLAATSCGPSSVTPIPVGFDNMSTQCLTFLPGTVRPYTPAITSTGGPCFVSAPFTLTLDLGGIPITLADAQIAATYVGTPASTLSNGLVRGFISEADANNTIIPASFPLVGGMALSSLLPGGAGNCAAHDDRDVNGTETGWWFYLNFPAVTVDYTNP